MTIVPTTTTNATSSQTGAEYSERFPWSDTVSSSTSHGNVQSGLIDRPEERREEEPVERERDRVAVLPLALGHEDVGGERERGAERGGDADDAERDPAPELDDDRQAGDAEDERRPDPPADVLVVDEAREERDEERAQELDEERDPDRQMVDRDEVEKLHEPDPGDAEDDEEEDLAAVGTERRAGEEEQEEQEADRSARSSGSASARATRAPSRGRPSTRSRSPRRGSRRR